MSPEQVRGEELDGRTDLFSFGAVLYEMATGMPAFQGETPVLICNSILNGSPTRAKRLNPEVPAALENILGKALEKDRELRYQSAFDMGAELRCLTPIVGSGHSAGLGRTGRLREAAFRPRVLVSVMLIIASAAFWRFVGVRTEKQPQPVERQITAHPPEDYVAGGAISPDGKTVAYHDQIGLYLRSVDSGETHALSLRPEFQNRISDLSWFPDGKRLLAAIYGSDTSGLCHRDLWTISASGEAPPRLLWRDVCQASISPDGGSIAFMRDMQVSSYESAGVWVAGIGDGSQRKLRARAESEFFFSPVWSPDGRWIAYLHVEKTADAYVTTIDVQPAAGGPTKTILSDSSLPRRTMICYLGAAGLCLSWSPDWRIVFSAHTDDWVRAPDTDYSLWEVSTKQGTAEATGKPKRLAHWSDFGPAGLAITADGKVLSFRKSSTWSDVYLAELASGTRMQPPRRFTLDNRGSYPSGWTLDSQAILFSSDRTATREIFRQALNVDLSAPIARASGKDCDGAVMSPDGSWTLFRESERVISNASASPVRLVRQRAPGGVPETVLEEPADMQWRYACGVKPHSSCILSQTEGADVVFYTLDPLRGKGTKLGQVKRPYWSSSAEWNISPDASRVAFVTNNGRIEVLSVRDRTWQEISLEPGWERLISIAWAADGNRFFVTCWRPDSFDLVYVNLTGKVTRLFQNGHRQWLINPLPSPNGKYLAFEAETWDSNIWMIENF
jgi:Tol biopolymer transport system component